VALAVAVHSVMNSSKAIPRLVFDIRSPFQSYRTYGVPVMMTVVSFKASTQYPLAISIVFDS
jgi:hypothetical protein